MNGHGKIDVQEEEFQNVIEPTHIPEIEKCPSRGIIRRKEEATTREKPRGSHLLAR